MRDPEVKEIILLPTGEAVVASAFTLRVILDHLLTPGVRWLFSRLASRVADGRNTPLHLQMPHFQRTGRQVLIVRLA